MNSIKEKGSVSLWSRLSTTNCHLDLYHVWSERDLRIPLCHQLVIKNKRHWPHLQGVLLPEVDWKKISMINGTNVPKAFISLEVHCGGPSHPTAIQSCLGFFLLGCMEGEPKRQHHNVHHIHTTTDDITLNEQVEEFWEYGSDSSGVLEGWWRIS